MFLWQFEEAMRNECGYKDYLPYWDNARFSEEPTKSAMWSGSDTSFGGNGIDLHLKDKELVFPGLAIPFHLPMPGGTGGGCITDGPFVDFKISLGPVVKTTLDPNNTYGYQPNPRCLSRNFDPASSIGLLTWANATKIISSPNIAALRGNVEQLWHKNSHTFIGGEGADPFSTTNDPAFYLLHAQIDRLWGIWQAQDLKEREYAIDGNRTFLGIPLDYAPHVPASLATIEDKMDMGLGFKPKTKMGMPMTKGGLCYIYE
jgi:tyrosinase